MKNRWFYAIISVVLPHILPAAPILFNTALPIAEGEYLLRGQIKYLQSTDDPTTANRELTVGASPVVFGYGLNEKWTLFGVVPYLNKRSDSEILTGRTIRKTSGVGDLKIFTRYTIYQQNRPQETTRFALFGGIEVPTGKDSDSDSLGKFPQPFQLGSGSWDAFGGAVLTWSRVDFQVDTSLAYEANTKANGFKFGDAVRADFSAQYRLLPKKLSYGTPDYFYGVLESNFYWQQQNEIAGNNDPDSGGVAWYLAPGMQYVTKRFIIEAAAQFPILQNLNGTALKNDFIVTTSFRFNF